MINLLPPEVKLGYRYARRNVQLRRWVSICLVALVILAVLATYGLLRIHQSTADYNDKIVAAQKLLKHEDFAGTQQQVEDISNSFKLVVKVLSQEILFSKLITQIAAAIPANADLTGLDINQANAGIDISAMATSYNAATQVQVNLADPANQIFSKADIVSVTCNSANSTNPAYPCNVTIRALFAANNPFLFINSGKLQPTAIGKTQCDNPTLRDGSTTGQMALSGGATCGVADLVVQGANGKKGGSYASNGYRCTAKKQGSNTQWSSIWNNAFYTYNCVNGSNQIAFNLQTLAQSKSGQP